MDSRERAGAATALAPVDPSPGVAITPRREAYDLADTRRERRFLGDDAFVELGTAIATGALSDGELIRDRDLAAQMGVSRTPVREAILQLQHIGLVEVLPSRRTHVTPLTRDIADDCRRWAGYCGGIAARQAAGRMTSADIDLATKRIQALLDALGSPANAAATALELLLFLSARAGSPILHSEISERQFSLLRALRRLAYEPEQITDAGNGCRALAEAITVRDSDRAEGAMRTIFGIN